MQNCKNCSISVNFLDNHSNFNVFGIISRERGVKMTSMKKVNPLFFQKKKVKSIKKGRCDL